MAAVDRGAGWLLSYATARSLSIAECERAVASVVGSITTAPRRAPDLHLNDAGGVDQRGNDVCDHSGRGLVGCSKVAVYDVSPGDDVSGAVVALQSLRLDGDLVAPARERFESQVMKRPRAEGRLRPSQLVAT